MKMTRFLYLFCQIIVAISMLGIFVIFQIHRDVNFKRLDVPFFKKTEKVFLFDAFITE